MNDKINSLLGNLISNTPLNLRIKTKRNLYTLPINGTTFECASTQNNITCKTPYLAVKLKTDYTLFLSISTTPKSNQPKSNQFLYKKKRYLLLPILSRFWIFSQRRRLLPFSIFVTIAASFLLLPFDFKQQNSLITIILLHSFLSKIKPEHPLKPYRILPKKKEEEKEEQGSCRNSPHPHTCYRSEQYTTSHFLF